MTHTFMTAGIAVLVGAGFSLAGFLSARKIPMTLDLFIANRRSTTALLSTASLVASVAGAWILFSPAETGTWAGITGLIGYSFGQALPLFLLVYLGSRLTQLLPQGYSLSEFLQIRYGGGLSLFASALMIFYMATFLTAELTGIALAFSLVLDIPLFACALTVMLLTLTYTVYGGLRSSIRTDLFQFLLLVPLFGILIGSSVFFLGGVSGIAARTAAEHPELLSLTFRPGIEFAIVLIIGITCSNLFHQGFWQRAYACRDRRTLKRSFLLSGLIVIPIVFLIGLFGIAARSYGLVAEGRASIALFSLLAGLPGWVLSLTLILGLVLVMSSLDTLLNGIVSLLVDPRSKDERKTLMRGRVLTAVIAALAVPVAAQGYSVLYLFLVADLVCSAAAFPLLFGMYGRHIRGREAIAAVSAGLVAGTLFFPGPDFTGWSGLPANMLAAFGLALAVSASLTLLFERLGTRRKPFDFGTMNHAEEV